MSATTMMPACPITGEPAEERVQTLSARLLHDLWRYSHGVAPTPMRRDGPRIGLYRSPCGLMFFHPRVEGDAAFYGGFYRYWQVHAKIGRTAGERVEYRAAAAHVRPGDRVLEIGAGSAAFARHLPEGAHYVGLDPHAGEYLGAEGIRAETVEDHAAHHSEAYDVVCAFQVIEHVAEPRALAEGMLRCLRPGGLLILVAPLWPSAITRVPNFVLNAPPHHLSWWNERAFAALARVLGLDPVAIERLPPTLHQGLIHWMARLSPVTPSDEGPYFRPRWRWHLSLTAGYLLAQLATAIRPLPRNAGPMDVMLVARKPPLPARA
ncbi:MAG: class I SAM-dependent methyltransferase [Acetobacteraceae bacterium]|nr:class I SAM-dependent methyltransferase [Acetobacteraceae bacterium]